MRVTIKQIAEMAGVHRGTVDKVIHNRPGVSDEVRERIRGLLEEYHYEVNPIGKALQMQNRELKIAVLLVAVDARPYLRRGVEAGLENFRAFQIQMDWQVTAYVDAREQVRQLRHCREQQVDGIVLSPIHHPAVTEEIDRCQEEGIPVVTVNLDDGGSHRMCYVGQNGFKAGEVAARFLGEFLQGRGRVAVVTNSAPETRCYPFGTREDGFRALLGRYYPAVQVLPSLYCQEDPAVMEDVVRALLEREPELAGLFITCGCVPAACEVLRQSGRRGIRVICFECYPEIRSLLQEGLVTLTLDSGLEQQGRESIEVLLDALIYSRWPEEKQIFSPIVPLVGESI